MRSSDLSKFFRTSWQDRLLLLDASISLLLAASAIRVLPFRVLGRLAARPVHRSAPSTEERASKLNRIRWAIVVCARRMPWARCFQQGLAAQLMLRRRGIGSTLYYGAAPNQQQGLSAHVWVRDGDIDVVGGEIASAYAVLATFPPTGSND
jgi:hypothetical protein